MPDMITPSLNRTLADIRRAVPSISGLRADQRGKVVGRYYGATISSVFQPWRLPTSGHVIAVEAYARSHSKHGEGVSPWQNFADSVVDTDLVTLDRLCRSVHALNHFTVAENNFPLVLNVDARLLNAVPERHGEFFGKVLTLLGVAPKNIVIEIRTIHQFDLTRLRTILASYRKYGFTVAVNAEGTLHARALADLLQPEFLLLDTLGISPEEIRRQVSMLSARGVRIGVKRIETAAMAEAVLDTGVDWVQGHHYDHSYASAPEKLAVTG